MNSDERLVLAPKDPLLQIVLEPLVKRLQAEQLVGEPLPERYGSGCYRVGERFFDAFLFLGCSPSVALDPMADGAPFCYLQLESGTECRVTTGSNLKAACGACKQRYGVLNVPASEAVPVVSCPHCGVAESANKIAWRKSGVVSRARFSLWNIFEGGAVPSNHLLKLLEQESGVEWSYAYIN